MGIRGRRTSRACALAALIVISGVTTMAFAKKPPRPSPPPAPEPPACSVEQPDYVLFLDDYPLGRFHLAVLPCLADSQVGLVSTRELALDLPRREQHKFQVANGDVYYDAGRGVRRIVFGGRSGNGDYWGIYEGVVDIQRGLITDIGPVVRTHGIREEDPRFSSDGSQIVYKCDGRICLVNSLGIAGIFHEEEGCELWAPSMYFNIAVSYARRCGGDPQSDRIVYHPIGAGSGTEVQNYGGGPDRFAHFTQTGDLVYSHVDTSDDTASLWMYIHNSGHFPLHNETTSDDDAYAERNGSNYIAFSGWGADRYDLYVYRASSADAVRLTSGINVLGSILFD